MEHELLTLPEHLSSPPVLSGVRVTRSLVLYVCFVNRCLSFFFWPLCCLFFFDIRFLIAPLVSSNSSCQMFSLFLFLICTQLCEIFFFSFLFNMHQCMGDMNKIIKVYVSMKMSLLFEHGFTGKNIACIL